MSATALRCSLCGCLSAPAASVTSAIGTGGARSGAPHPAGAGAQRTRRAPHRWSSSAGFTRRLADLEAGRLARLTILQIGDSHTEAEHFSGHLRALFQARFGNAGRGMLAPGSPVDYWRPYQVRAQQAGKWQVFTSNKSDHAASAVRIVRLRRPRRQPHRHHDAGGRRRQRGLRHGRDRLLPPPRRRHDRRDGRRQARRRDRHTRRQLRHGPAGLPAGHRRPSAGGAAAWRRQRGYGRLGSLQKFPRRRADEPRLLGRAGRHHGPLGLDHGCVSAATSSTLRSSCWPSAPTRATRPRAACRTTRAGCEARIGALQQAAPNASIVLVARTRRQPHPRAIAAATAPSTTARPASRCRPRRSPATTPCCRVPTAACAAGTRRAPTISCAAAQRAVALRTGVLLLGLAGGAGRDVQRLSLGAGGARAQGSRAHEEGRLLALGRPALCHAAARLSTALRAASRHGIPDPEFPALLPGAVAGRLGAGARRPPRPAQARDHRRQLFLLRLLELEAGVPAARQRPAQLGRGPPDRSRQAPSAAAGGA